MRRTVAQFAVTGLAAVLLLGFVAVQLLRSSGTSDAIAEAKRLSRLAGEGIAAPLLTPALLRGDPRAVDRLDRALEQSVVRGPFVRVKVWDADGRIVYSDEHRLIGARYALGADDLDALRRGTLDAELSDLSEPENRYERRYGELLEVYDGIRAPDGRRLLFESYQPFSSIAASGRRTWLRFLPALLGVLLLLELVQVPLAYLLARRLRDARARARRAPAARARRVGGRAAADRARPARRPGADPRRRRVLARRGGRADRRRTTRRSARWSTTRPAGRARPCASCAARSSTSTPRRSSAPGCAPRSATCSTAWPARGIETRCDVPRDLRLPPEVEALLFRVARESLHNVRKHAAAGARRGPARDATATPRR